MKKLLPLFACVAMLICSGIPALAQNNAPTKYIYCELLGTNANVGKALTGVSIGKDKVTIEVDFGQISSSWSDQRLRGEDGKPMKFNSMVDAMNWMGEKGWEFVQAYVITVGNQNVLHWLLKLDIATLSPEDVEAIKESLKTKATSKEDRK